MFWLSDALKNYWGRNLIGTTIYTTFEFTVFFTLIATCNYALEIAVTIDGFGIHTREAFADLLVQSWCPDRAW